MKKIILAALLLFSIKTFSQATYTDQAGKWRLGINAGAMWQTCDVTAHANIAGGFTIERILNRKADALIGFSLGLRYLSGHCTGLDTKPSYGVANNTALNGTYDTTLNYAKHGGIFYNNYKSYIHEGALELKLNFPRFEQKTNLIFHIMGGIGICNYKTWINALDANGNMYDFTTLQNSQNVTSADVKKFLNGSYGTLAQGSSPTGTTTWLPSVGVGFGFKLSKHAALVFEYRAAFPRTNLLDGVTYDMNNEPIKNNDFYNYISANLLFTIYGKQHKSSYNTTPVYTNATPNTYTNPHPVTNNNYYNNNYSTPPVNNGTVYTQPQVYPPYVNISYPANNYSSQTNYISVQGSIQNIQSANQVSISQNGFPIKYFSYDPYNGTFNFQTFLQQGTNNIVVTANSQYGTGSQGVTVFYNPPYVPNSGGMVYPNNGGNYTNNTYQNNTTQTVTINSNAVTPTNTVNPTGPHFGSGTVVPTQLDSKPIVQFVNPFSSPEDVTSPTFNVSATVQNVTLANQITVSVNGTNVQQISFNPSTKVLNFTANLLTGFNSIHISATNSAGSDSKSTVIDYKPTSSPPRIDVFNPASSPFTSLNQNMIVSGYVYNVTSSSDIAVNYNGNVVSFNYNNNTHEIDIPVSLISGTNQLNITANNSFGNDVKQVTLVYQPTFTTSGGSPFGGNQTQPSFTVNPHTYNGNTQTQPTLTATANNPFGGNQTQPSFTVNPHTYNGNTQTQPTLTATANNPFGGNQTQPSFTVNPHTYNNNQTPPTFTATQGNPYAGEGNNTGTGNGSESNNVSGGGIHRAPEITLASPQSTPFTTMSGVISISANLNYVYSSSNASVTYDGNPVSCSFNPVSSELLNFTSPLKPGMNTFVIKASNPYGTVTKTVDINYVPTNPNGNVNGNPSLHFSNGFNNNTNPPRGFSNQNTAPVQNINQGQQQQQQSTPGRPFRPR